MRIQVRSLQGEEHIVDVQNDQRVSQLKLSVSEKPNGPPVARQKLVYKGRTMQDSCLIADYNLEEGCKVHLILQKEYQSQNSQAPIQIGTTKVSSDTSSPSGSCDRRTLLSERLEVRDETKTGSGGPRVQSRFEIILRERLAKHFPAESVEKIMTNLQHEINADINSSSLDDLERLAKQKLNISNE